MTPQDDLDGRPNAQQGSGNKLWTQQTGGSWLIRSGKEDVADVSASTEESTMLEDMLIDCVGNEVVDERLLELWVKGYMYATDQERRTFLETLSASDRTTFSQALNAQRKRSGSDSGESPGALASSPRARPTSALLRRKLRANPASSNTPQHSAGSGSHIERLRQRTAELAADQNRMEEAIAFVSNDAGGMPRRGLDFAQATHAEAKALEKRAADLAARRKQMEQADSFLARRPAF